MSLGKAPEDTHIFSVGQRSGPDVVTGPGSEEQTPVPELRGLTSDGGLASAPLTVSWDTSAVATTNIME